nr:MAG TPA: hypothetical protein [Caudoviricetes sp.]
MYVLFIYALSCVMIGRIFIGVIRRRPITYIFLMLYTEVTT